MGNDVEIGASAICFIIAHPYIWTEAYMKVTESRYRVRVHAPVPIHRALELWVAIQASRHPASRALHIAVHHALP